MKPSVLVVGGAGYIGAHTNALLNALGVETVVLDSLVYGHREALSYAPLASGHSACGESNSAFAPFSHFCEAKRAHLSPQITPSSALTKSQNEVSLEKSSQNPRIAAVSESVAKVSKEVSESAIPVIASIAKQSIESTPHTTAESPTDSETENFSESQSLAFLRYLENALAHTGVATAGGGG